MLNQAHSSLPQTDQPISGSEKSFQAKILAVGDDRVAKIYGRQHLYDLVDLRDNGVRADLMRRECECLNSLSPGLNARIEEVTVPGVGRELALTMKRLQPTDFVDTQIAKGGELSDAKLTQLAQKLVNFHFDPSVCPSARTGSANLESFLREQILVPEQNILAKVSHGIASAAETRLTDMAFTSCHVVLQKNSAAVGRFEQILGEPIVGHGDVKTQNLAFTADGSVYVLDTAPHVPWRINTRRMDAAFLKVELELSGKPEQAQTFWSAYDGAYRAELTKRQCSAESDPVLQKGIEVTDLVGAFYRNLIFYRLTFLGVDPERRTPCLQNLSAIGSKMQDYR